MGLHFYYMLLDKKKINQITQITSFNFYLVVLVKVYLFKQM